MNHDYLATLDEAICRSLGDHLILLGSDGENRVEMTRANHSQLQREMARMLDDPLEALMAQVALEYMQMGPAAEEAPKVAA